MLLQETRRPTYTPGKTCIDMSDGQPPAQLKRSCQTSGQLDFGRQTDSRNGLFSSKSLNVVLHYKYTVLMSAWVCESLIVTLGETRSQMTVYTMTNFALNLLLFLCSSYWLDMHWFLFHGTPYCWTCLEWKFLKKLLLLLMVCPQYMFRVPDSCRGWMNAYRLNQL